jgi:hypothetical protein
MPAMTSEVSDFVLKALDYGVLGLCAITLLLVVAIIRAEQNREGYPRKGIIHLSFAFMALCLALASINGYVQIRELAFRAEKTTALQSKLATATELIGDYRSLLSGLDATIRAKLIGETSAPGTDPYVIAIANDLKRQMDEAKDEGLLDPPFLKQ